MIYDIYFCNLDRSTVLQIPVLPEKMPELQRSSKNEEFETFDNGTFNLIGNIGLLTFSLECFLPAVGKNYSFAKVNKNPDEYINFLNLAMLNKTPIKVIATRSNGTDVFNDLFTVESFSWYEDKKFDYQYKIDFKQYRELS